MVARCAALISCVVLTVSHELFVKLQEAKAALDTQVKGSV